MRQVVESIITQHDDKDKDKDKKDKKKDDKKDKGKIQIACKIIVEFLS